MPEASKKPGESALFIIGKRELGIVFVRTNPLRVSMVTPAEIESWGKEKGIDGFADAAAGAALLFEEVDGDVRAELGDDARDVIRNLLGNTTLSNADIALAAGVDLSEVDIKRKSVNPIYGVIDSFNSKNADNGEIGTFGLSERTDG